MTSEQMKDTVRRLMDAFNRGDYAAVESILSPDFVEHEFLGPGVPPTLDGVMQWLKTMKQAFPDLHFETEKYGVDGNTVWARGMVTGTHRGEFMGIPATGKSFHIEYMDELRFDRNQIVEHWGQTDVMGMMQQLGMTQMSGAQSQ